jgi:hypothetical protein
VVIWGPSTLKFTDMQPKEPAASERLGGIRNYDHGSTEAAEPLERKAEASPGALNWRSPFFGVIFLVAVAGGIASGLIPIGGFDITSSTPPPVVESQLGPIEAPSAPTGSRLTQESAEGRLAALNTMPAQTESPATQQSSGATFPLVLPSELDAAISAMTIPEPEKTRLRQEMKDGDSRLVWIGLSDSVTEDGDRVIIESLGYSQEVRLFHRTTFVAVPVRSGTPILIKGLVDGDNTGITVALHLRSAVLPLAPFRVGTTIQVPVP